MSNEEKLEFRVAELEKICKIVFDEADKRLVRLEDRVFSIDSEIPKLSA